MNYESIIKAVDSGVNVFWGSMGYQVIKDDIGQYFVQCKRNKDCVKLLPDSDTSRFFINDWLACEIVESTIRLNNCVYGNPRYYIPLFCLEGMTEKTRKANGVKFYRGKKYGSGYVISSYSIENDIRNILKEINA